MDQLLREKEKQGDIGNSYSMSKNNSVNNSNISNNNNNGGNNIKQRENEGDNKPIFTQ